MLIRGAPAVPTGAAVSPLAAAALLPWPVPLCGSWPAAQLHRTSAAVGVSRLPAGAVAAGAVFCARLGPLRARQRGASRSTSSWSAQKLLEADGGPTATRLQSRRADLDELSSEERLREVESLVALDDSSAEASLRTPEPVLEYEESAASVRARYGDVRRVLPRLPLLPEPGYRAFAANVPGDTGFDPLGLCTDVQTFVKYREAELKHGRLAMLAALAWPLAEIGDSVLVEDYNLPDVLAESGGRLIPQLSGGIGDEFVEYFVALVLLVGAIFELNVTKQEGSAPGDYNFDPLGLISWKAPSWMRSLLPTGRPWMNEAELKHGRLAMFVVFYDVLDELLTGNPVVEDTEYIFHRIDTKLLRWDYWTLQPSVLDDVSGAIDSIS